ncbi:MAG: ribosome-associated protein [Idiomarinaceae bacterium HL-53]|nr:MAG: ribosome-associated protein [Idiomarinaceae bacterium HL-53]CUS47438.1 ribosome-associated protein [Idiomarinaceae bacterium HL-53]
MTNEHDEDDFVSKSERKRDVLAITDLGRQLVDLPPGQLNELPLSDEVLAAVQLAKKIRNKHVGFKRQIQFIGKLLRHDDPQPIFDALAAKEQEHLHQQAHFHALEQWRDRILAEGDSAIQAFIDEHPGADRQHIRQLVRLAQKQKAENKPPAAFRELFKYLREIS